MSRYMGDNEWDDTLAGERGEVWPIGEGKTGEGMYKAICVDNSGHEEILTLTNQQLTKVINRLRVPLNPNEQLPWANNPNRRLRGKTKRV